MTIQFAYLSVHPEFEKKIETNFHGGPDWFPIFLWLSQVCRVTAFLASPPPQDPQKRPTIGQVLHQPFMVAARDQTATSARPVPAGGLEVYVPKGVCPGVGDGGGGPLLNGSAHHGMGGTQFLQEGDMRSAYFVF